MDWTPIILAVLALIGTVITVIIKPLVTKKLEEAKAKLDTEQREKLDYWMRVLIAAAETVYTETGAGEKKTAWVIQQLANMGLSFDEDLVAEAIKGLCRELTASGVINSLRATH